jgi:rRNA maturation protein Nop10
MCPLFLHHAVNAAVEHDPNPNILLCTYVGFHVALVHWPKFWPTLKYQKYRSVFLGHYKTKYKKDRAGEAPQFELLFKQIRHKQVGFQLF